MGGEQSSTDSPPRRREAIVHHELAGVVVAVEQLLYQLLRMRLEGAVDEQMKLLVAFKAQLLPQEIVDIAERHFDAQLELLLFQLQKTGLTRNKTT